MEKINTILGDPRNKVNNNLDPRTPRSSKSQRDTDNLADYLVEKFQSPEFRPLFLKAAWRLERSTIERMVAQSFELGKNPRAYFISLVKREKAYYG